MASNRNMALNSYFVDPNHFEKFRSFFNRITGLSVQGLIFILKVIKNLFFLYFDLYLLSNLLSDWNEILYDNYC